PEGHGFKSPVFARPRPNTSRRNIPALGTPESPVAYKRRLFATPALWSPTKESDDARAGKVLPRAPLRSETGRASRTRQGADPRRHPHVAPGGAPRSHPDR